MCINKQGKATTIKDIAARANVSMGTVSRVLNKSDLVSRSTKKKVERIAEELGYIPNEMARSLLRNKSHTIALIAPDLTNPFFVELFRGIEEVMSREGYYIFVCNTKYEKENEHRYTMEMIGRGVDGIIFTSLYHHNEALFNLVKKNVSAVTVQTRIEDINCILANVTEAGIEACMHLFELGHRKIGYVCLDRNQTVDRLSAYLRAHERAGVAVREEYIVDGYPLDSLGHMAAKQLLELPDPPTAIQFYNDYTALGAYNAILDKGLRIPEDISVVGYDDIPIAKLLSPPLTTVAQPILDIGRSAGETLLNMIKHESSQLAREVWLPTKLVIRDSTAKPGRDK